MNSHLLIWSPSLEELERAFIAEVTREKADDPLAPAMVMVGSFPLAVYLQRRIARETGGMINIRFATLERMARILGAADLEREAGLQRLDPTIESMVLSAVINGTRYSYLHPVKDLPGFKAALKSTLRDLRDSGLLPILEGRLQESDLPPKWKEVLGTARDFHAAWEGRFCDSAGLLEAAAKNAGRFREIFNAGRLFIYGLYDFTRLQAEMIKALADAAPLSVYMPFTGGKAMRFADRGKRWFMSIPGMEEKSIPHPSGEGGLARVRMVLSGGIGPPPEVRDDQVEIVAAPGEPAEVEQIAGRIVALAGRGIAFHEMAVLILNEQEYLPLLREVFDRASIPYYLPLQDPASESPEGRCIERLLRLLPEGGGRDYFRPEVISFLTDPLAAQDPEAAGRWGDYSIEAGIISGREEWDARLAALAEGLARSNDLKREQEARDLREHVLGLIDRIAAAPAKGWEYLIEWFRGLLQDHTLIAPEFHDGLETLKDLDGLGVEAGIHALKAAVRDWLGRARESGEGFQQGRVTVAQIMSMRLVRFKAVFVPGLMSRSFPGPRREDPILPDREREEMENLAGMPDALPRKSSRPVEERLLFNLMVQAAKERLILSYARTDESGTKERLPSPFLLEVASALAGKPVDYSGMAAGKAAVKRVPLSIIRALPNDRNAARRPPLTQAEFVLWESAISIMRGHKPPPLACSFHPFLDRSLKMIAQRKKPATGPCQGRLVDAEALQLLSDAFLQGRRFSAGELETYARCPFLYMCQRVLRLQSVELPEKAGFDAADRGIVYHEVLRRFYLAAMEDRLLPLARSDRARLLEIMRGLLDEEMDGRRRALGRASRARWEVLKQEMISSLPQVLDNLIRDEHPDYRPRFLEKAFGLPDREGDMQALMPEPIPIDLPDGEVIELCGRIDRIDQSEAKEGGIRVIDYKTGANRTRKKDRVRCGTMLQGALYLLAAAGLCGREIDDLTGSESGYLYVLDRGLSSRKGEADYVEHALRAVAAIAAGIRKGVFAPLPAATEQDACARYCEMAEVCAGGTNLHERIIPSDPAAKVREEIDGFD